jgi:predicted CxxxxCH...CXXCH cytochrome family protein
VDGKAVYDSNCAACHKLGTYDATGNPDLAGKSGSITGKLSGGHMGVSLTTAQRDALVTFVGSNTPAPAPAPAPTPTPAPAPVDGKTVYDSNCAACHKLGTYDASGSPDLAGKSASISGKLSGGHMGISLTTTQRDALVSFVSSNSSTPAPAPSPTPTPAPAPAPTNCTSCHGQPPAGTAFPNTAGAHAAHKALPSIGTNCAVCHQGYAHQNGEIELGFPSAYNAKTGAVIDNGDGTCSNVSCHGGKKTPSWWTGKIDVNTQCTSCHASGTGQYNSYSSGRHSKHAGYACIECHDTAKLAANHFNTLNTSAMEGPASGTLKSSLNYNGSSCTVTCHGENHQGDRWR